VSWLAANTSLYASIVAHSEDHEQPGSPFDFGQTFAAALTAAGLDAAAGSGGAGAGAGAGEGSGSDDWQLVEASSDDDEGGAGKKAGGAAASGSAK
jgi:hypothetical protein